MADTRPFRFGALVAQLGSRQELQETARRIESAGYSTLLMTDHLGEERYSPIPALVCAADATSDLRVGTLVLNNDLRHPAVLAGEIATVDIVTDGRFEPGIGAGWEKEDYDRSGIRLDSAPDRISRLDEALQILNAYFTSDSVSFTGEHYQVTNLPSVPHPVQEPKPPMLVGGGGKRILTVAARQADIIGVHVPAKKDGSAQDWSSAGPNDVEKRIGWIRDAAGDRMSRIELCQNVFAVNITDDRQAAGAEVAKRFGMTDGQALESPYFLLGTEDQIADQLQHNRVRFGISYYIVPGRLTETMQPLVKRLAGK